MSNGGFGFSRRQRLTQSQELQTVIREGKRIRTVHLDVRFSASPLDVSRVGIVVPRHQHSAVDRNRLKRQLRELVRIELLPALGGTHPEAACADVSIRARREAYDASFTELQIDVRTVAERLTPPAPSAPAQPAAPETQA